MLDKGIALLNVKRLKEALAVFEEVYTRFRSEGESHIVSGAVGSALVYQAFALEVAQQARPTRRRQATYQIATRARGRHRQSTENARSEYDADPTSESAARAMVAKGSAFAQMGRRRKALATYGEVIDHFGARSRRGSCGVEVGRRSAPLAS